MAEKFDPYHLWLGIAEKDQPPHHYSLLGLARFESDPEIIENAADQRMAFIRPFQTGKHAQECQRLLNELSEARVCLLNEDTRAVYDKQLRARLGKKKRQAGKSTSAAKSAPSKQLKTRKQATGQKTSPASGKRSGATTSTSVSSRVTAKKTTSQAARRGLKKRSAFPVSWAIGIAAVLLLALGAAFLSRGNGDNDKGAQSGDDKKSVVSKSPKDKSSAKPSKGDKKKPSKKEPPKSKLPEAQDPDKGKPVKVELPEVPELPPKEEEDPGSETPLKNPFVKPSGEPKSDTPEDPLSSPSESEPSLTRQPIPEATTVEDLLKEIQQSFQFAQARTTDGKLELADRLLKASATSESSAQRYVLIDQAWRWAQQAGDFRLALDTIATLGEQFEVDDLMLAEGVISSTRIPTKMRDENLALAQAGSDLMWQAVEEEKFELAVKLGNTTTSLARRIGDIDLAKEIAAYLKDIRNQQKAHEALAEALATIESTPEDPAANFAAGRYYCLIREDWETGLPYLSHSQEDPWSSLAKEELGGIDEASAQLALANHWWDLAGKLKDSEKQALLRHAAIWYEEVLPSLNQLERIRIEKRLATIDEQAPGGVKQPKLPAEGLVAHYRFDERSGDVAKDLVGKRDGKIFSAERVEGPLGRALLLDGLDDSVVIPNLETLLGGTASLAAWIKTQQRGDPKYWLQPGLAGFERPGEFGDVFWGILDPLGRIGITCGNRGAATSTTSVSDDQWHHVVIMRDADSGRVAVAVDGQVQSENFSGRGMITQGFRTLGYVSQSQGKKNPTGFYAGALDDVRIYNRILTTEEIASFVGKGTGAAAVSTRPQPGRRPSRVKGPVPVVHWPLDEGQGTEVKDANGKVHLRVVGAQWVEGVAGSALKFDGLDDHIAVPQLGTNDAFTLAMWIRPESLRAKFSSLFHNHGWKDRGLHVHVQSSGRFTFDIKGIKVPGQGQESLSSRSPIRMGVWQHVAVAYDKNAGKAAQYINGQLDATHLIARPAPCQFGPGRFGGWDGAEHRFFHGTIDDVRLYNQALSPDDVAAVVAEARKKRRGR